MKEIKIDNSRLIIDDKVIDGVVVTGYEITNFDTENEFTKLTISVLAPKTDIKVSGIV